MNSDIRKELILHMLQKRPDTGKTAVMKTMFILQQVKGVEVGCDFSIYTYGPYATDIMEDIDELVASGFISSTPYSYHNCIGYDLKLTNYGTKSINPLDEESEVALTDVVNFTQDKSAKELELYSTIIYIDSLYTKNSWGNDETTITLKVHEIKPRFSVAEVESAYQQLKAINYI